MESGLEDRNNPRGRARRGPVGSVSMESGLEDRNNPKAAWNRWPKTTSQWSPA